tara:strand:+ start:190 stop:504 length:315 start_codon:yes stop_codon:yes gene_type:complete
MDALLDNEVIDIINDMIEVEYLDQGIGYYEYGDGKYFDENWNNCLTNQTIVVQYPLDTDSVIYTKLYGYYEDDNGELEWVAELETIKWNQDLKLYDVTYDVYEP